MFFSFPTEIGRNTKFHCLRSWKYNPGKQKWNKLQPNHYTTQIFAYKE